MRILPCPSCGSAKDPQGGPLTIGWISSSPYRYHCFGCSHSISMTAPQINQLPLLSEPEIEALGIGRGKPIPPLPLIEKSYQASGILSPLGGVLITPPFRD